MLVVDRNPNKVATVSPRVLALVLVLLIAASLRLLPLAANGTLDLGYGILVAISLFALTYAWMGRSGSHRVLLSFLYASMFLRFSVALLAQRFVLDIYGGGGDAAGYQKIGTEIAVSLNQDLIRGLFGLVSLFASDRSLQDAFFSVSGILYYLTGASFTGVSVIIAWCASIGSYLFARAAYDLLPQKSSNAYAVAVFFLPSIIFWTSAPLKDGLTFLGIALFALGVSFLIRKDQKAWLAFAIGAAIIFFVRNYFLFYLFVPLALLFGLRVKSLPIKFTLVAVFLFAAIVVIRLFFAERSLDEIIALLCRSNAGIVQYGLGESTFTNPICQDRSNAILLLPTTALGVLFQPFLWDARNLFGFLTAVDDAALIYLFFLSVTRLFSVSMPKPFAILLLFAFVSLLLFVVSFSIQVSNFGTMARIRTSFLPFLFLPLALPFRVGQKRVIDSESGCAETVKLEHSDTVGVMESK